MYIWCYAVDKKFNIRTSLLLYISYFLRTLHTELKTYFFNVPITYFKHGIKNVLFQYVTRSVPFTYFTYGIKNVPFQYVTRSVPFTYFTYGIKTYIFSMLHVPYLLRTYYVPNATF